jgi:hypothetical protein
MEINTSRRGFLGAMLAAAVAPAFVRADSLMQLVVPNKEIILPSLELALPSGMAAGTYTASVWVKNHGGVWERIVKTFEVAAAGRAIKIAMPSENPLVYGLQLEANGPLQFPRSDISIAVSNGAVRFDPQRTPFMPGEQIA